jgi:hypothetical protein
MPLVLVLLLLLVPARLVMAQEASPLAALASDFHLLPRDAEVVGAAAVVDAAPSKPNNFATAVFSGGVILGSAANSFHESPHQTFHFTQEGFFARNTYAGGADKASHFVDYAMLSKELKNAYSVLGYGRTTSIWLGFGVATAAGLMTEIGDGTTFFGFSYEDFVMDTLGAGAAAVVAATRTEDLFGFRHGFLLPTSGRSTCCAVEGKGRDYSNEIYTADLKLEGIGRRLGIGIGPLRYLMVSLTYGTKGYPSGVPELRERQVGIEIGLNFEQILNDVRVTRSTWWGYGLHLVFDNIRFPFTSVGVRYDLNHDQWRGPNNGNTFRSP